MQPNRPTFCGVFTAIVTPFKPDLSVDHAALRQLVQNQIKNGIHGIVACGTTGESATLSDDEKLKVVRTCVEAADQRVPVIAGAGSNDTKKACYLTQLMEQEGAQATLQVTPYYNRPTQEGLYQHYQAISDTAQKPIIMYNVPARTGIDLLPSTVLRLAKNCPNIIGLKECVRDAERTMELITALALIRPDFSMLSGEDGFFLPWLAMGGHGIISVVSNIAPQEMGKLYEAVQNNDLIMARSVAAKLIPLISAIFSMPAPITVKTALAFQGALFPGVRLPLCSMSEEEQANFKTSLSKLEM